MGFACKTHKINVRITHGLYFQYYQQTFAVIFSLVFWNWRMRLRCGRIIFFFQAKVSQSLLQGLKNDRRTLRFSALCHLIYEPLKACVCVNVCLQPSVLNLKVYEKITKVPLRQVSVLGSHVNTPWQLFSIAIGVQVQVLSTWMWKDRNIRNCWLSLCFIFQNMVSYFTKWHFVFLFC